MSQSISIDVYQLLEDKLGRDEAKKVASAIEVGFEVIEKKAEAVALQKKLELKDELTKELATKADLLTLREEFLGEIKVLRQEMQTIKVEIEGKIATLRMEFRVYFVILLAVIILVSPRAIDLIAKFLGVIK